MTRNESPDRPGKLLDGEDGVDIRLCDLPRRPPWPRAAGRIILNARQRAISYARCVTSAGIGDERRRRIVPLRDILNIDGTGPITRRLISQITEILAAGGRRGRYLPG